MRISKIQAQPDEGLLLKVYGVWRVLRNHLRHNNRIIITPKC